MFIVSDGTQHVWHATDKDQSECVIVTVYHRVARVMICSWMGVEGVEEIAHADNNMNSCG